jgi:glycosyltransferase involved in cell wall biosynthesis
MRVELLDPPAYSPQYDAALAAALARAGAEVTLVTSRFAYGDVPAADGYRREEFFYRRAVGPAGSPLRAATKRLAHGPDLLRYRRVYAERRPDVIHLQWSTRLDARLMPAEPTVLTVHDPHGAAGLTDADAVIVHTAYARRQLVAQVRGLDPERVHVIHHGPLELPPGGALPPELTAPTRPVVLCFGLIRPYKGIETLLAGWRDVSGAELWIVGRPTYALEVPAGVRYVPRYVTPTEQAAVFAAADIVVLPYLESERFGFSGVLATAMAAGKATVVSELGGFSEAVAAGAVVPVAPGDAGQLAGVLQKLIDHPQERLRLGAAASQAAENLYSWDGAAEKTLALYRTIATR